MQVFGVILLGLIACSHAMKVPSGRIISLSPQLGSGAKENNWELLSDPGSKMILTCLFQTYSCRMATIKVFDGEKFVQYCPEKTQIVLQNSHKNKMSVTIVNVGSRIGAFCQVTATKPYIDVKSDMIDSSEHGTAPGSCGKRNHRAGRIVNGKEAGINEFTFSALIILEANGFPFCGGSIITKKHILTAAHCTEPFRNRRLAAVVGEHDIRTWKETKHTKIHSVSDIYQHIGYTAQSNKDDIAILELKDEIQFSQFVGPVCLPTSQKNLIHKFIKVMGWGLEKDKSVGGKASPVLRHTNLRVIDPEICNSMYHINLSPLTQICTYNDDTDSCQGDSGGPLVHSNGKNYVQVALVSYGRKCASTDPAVNTDVAYYMQWIRDQLKKCRVKVELFHS